MAKFNVVNGETGEYLASGYKVRGAAMRKAARFPVRYSATVVEVEDLNGWEPADDPDAWKAKDAALIAAVRARRA